MTILKHLRLPSPCSYHRASTIQEHLVALHHTAKHAATSKPPPPLLLTAEFNPVYTLGRRERDNLPSATLTQLLASNNAELVTTNRGGQITFHGPGQLVAYLVLDLKRHKLTPRCYIRFLETSVIDALKHFGLEAYTTENPGVWVSDQRKITAVGVRMQRYITSHGVGLNVNTDQEWWRHIVACGLQGKEMTSMAQEGVQVDVAGVEGVFTRIVADGLKLKAVENVNEEEVLNWTA